MQISPKDSVVPVSPGTTPAYNSDNPLTKLLELIERVELAAEREFYRMDEMQYLFTVDRFDWHGPAGNDWQVTDPKAQLNKEDFQKQNVRKFYGGPVSAVRGWVTDGEFEVPFLRLSYLGGPDTPLAKAANQGLGDAIRVWCRIGDVSLPVPVRMPYNDRSDKYEIEFWGFPGANLPALLDVKGKDAIARGELVARPDLLRGTRDELARELLDNKTMSAYATHHSMHPILPLNIECAFSTENGAIWDNNKTRNYRLSFSMLHRGFYRYLGTGISPNPHGGIGFLQFMNLFSNYFGYKSRPELGRALEAWNLDANGNTGPAGKTEKFLSVDYMDLHLLRGRSGIGLHRHRDNQEVFLVMRGQGFMVTGDWCEQPDQERCLEVRTLTDGDLTLVKPGGLHALMNNTDEDMHLFMFGGYD